MGLDFRKLGLVYELIGKLALHVVLQLFDQNMEAKGQASQHIPMVTLFFQNPYFAIIAITFGLRDEEDVYAENTRLLKC